MNKLIFSILFSLGLSLASCGVTRDTHKMAQVKRGMTQQEITDLMGLPMVKNGDENGEEWGYPMSVGGTLGPESVIFFVHFDEGGKVNGYETEKFTPYYARHNRNLAH